MAKLDEYAQAIKEMAGGFDGLWAIHVIVSDPPAFSPIVSAIDDAVDVSEGDWVRVIDEVRSDDLRKFMSVYLTTKSQSKAEASIPHITDKTQGGDDDQDALPTPSETLHGLVLFAISATALLDFAFLLFAESDPYYSGYGKILPPIISDLLEPLTTTSSSVNLGFGIAFFFAWLALALSGARAILGKLIGFAEDPLYLRLRDKGGFSRIYLVLLGGVFFYGAVFSTLFFYV